MPRRLQGGNGLRGRQARFRVGPGERIQSRVEQQRERRIRGLLNQLSMADSQLEQRRSSIKALQNRLAAEVGETPAESSPYDTGTVEGTTPTTYPPPVTYPPPTTYPPPATYPPPTTYPPANFYLDAASLKTSLVNNLWTISGNVIGGTPGTQAWVGIFWGLNGQKALSPTGTETQVASALITLTGTTTPFTLQNVTPPAPPYQYVLTIADSTRSVETAPSIVPPPSPPTPTPPYYLDAASLKTSLANNLWTISGNVIGGTPGTLAWVRVWQGLNGQKLLGPTGSETLVASTQVYVSGGTTYFTLPNVLPSIAQTVGLTNQLVITVSDTSGSGETNPLVVPPPPSPAPTPAYSVDPASLKVSLGANNSLTVSGNVVGVPPNQSVEVRAWQVSWTPPPGVTTPGPYKAQTPYEVQLGAPYYTLPTPSGGVASFTLTNIPQQVPPLLVGLTVSQLDGSQETNPVPVPPPTPTPTYAIDPASLMVNLGANNTLTISGNVVGATAGQQLQVRAWQTTPVAPPGVMMPPPYKGQYLGVFYAMASGGTVSFTLSNIPQQIAPYGVGLTVSQIDGSQETSLVPIPSPIIYSAPSPYYPGTTPAPGEPNILLPLDEAVKRVDEAVAELASKYAEARKQVANKTREAAEYRERLKRAIEEIQEDVEKAEAQVRISKSRSRKSSSSSQASQETSES